MRGWRQTIGWGVVVVLLAGCSASNTAQITPTSAAVSVASAEATSLPSRVAVAPAIATAALTATATAAPTATTTATATSTATAPTATAAPAAVAAWSYPIGRTGQPLGDGFFMRHGYTVENTWFSPGNWHTGEDWYALAGDTAGAAVVAVAAGEVVYAGSNYPGRVVIVQHAPDLFSMYGHLDPALAVQVGQQVARSDRLGTVLRRADDVPNHLHFEIRTFLTTAEVNGDQPRYGFRCGPGCVPGPGYWPIRALELPDALGWRNPTHVINGRMLPELDSGARGEVVVATQPASASVTLWSEFADDGRPQGALGDVRLEPGTRYPLLNVRAGAEAPQTSSADAYQVWYRIALPDERTGWVQAAVSTSLETGSDGRSSTVQLNLVPQVGGGL